MQTLELAKLILGFFLIFFASNSLRTGRFRIFVVDIYSEENLVFYWLLILGSFAIGIILLIMTALGK